MDISEKYLDNYRRVTVDIIEEHLDNMTPAQLRHNARMALYAEACQGADPEGISDDREFLLSDALSNVHTGNVRITWPAYERAVELSDKPDEVAAANWHRRLLNVVPLLDEWEEQDPSTFIGYLGDHHTLPRPPAGVCEDYAARMPWVQVNLLHGPRWEDHPVYRQLAQDVAHAEDQCRRGFAHAEVRERAHSNLAGWCRRHLADLAVFTAHLPDELFIP